MLEPLPPPGSAVPNVAATRQDEITDLADNAGLGRILGQRAGVAPIQNHRHTAVHEGLTRPDDIVALSIRRTEFQDIHVILHRPHPARVVDLRSHGIGIEELGAPKGGVVGVGRGSAEHVPELLATMRELFRRTV